MAVPDLQVEFTLDYGYNILSSCFCSARFRIHIRIISGGTREDMSLERKRVLKSDGQVVYSSSLEGCRSLSKYVALEDSCLQITHFVGLE